MLTSIVFSWLDELLEMVAVVSMSPGVSLSLPVSPECSLRSASGSHPGSVQITMSFMGLRMCVLHTTFENRLSVSYSPLSLLYPSPASLPRAKPERRIHMHVTYGDHQMFWGIIFLAGPLDWEGQCGVQTPYSLGRTSTIVIILLL